MTVGRFGTLHHWKGFERKGVDKGYGFSAPVSSLPSWLKFIFHSHTVNASRISLEQPTDAEKHDILCAMLGVLDE